MLGFGAFQFLFTADTIFVKAYFAGEVTDAYGGAGTLSRALMWLVGPLAAVMFPRIVHSAARAEKSDLMRAVLLGTFVLAATGAIGLWLVGPFVVKLIYPARYATQAIALLPWYAWAMVPLALANVLLNNLLARGAFRVVPGLIVLALGTPLRSRARRSTQAPSPCSRRWESAICSCSAFPRGSPIATHQRPPKPLAARLISTRRSPAGVRRGWPGTNCRPCPRSRRRSFPARPALG